eukprot:4060995-Amphidinium_carterae.1
MKRPLTRVYTHRPPGWRRSHDIERRFAKWGVTLLSFVTSEYKVLKIMRQTGMLKPVKVCPSCGAGQGRSQ